MGTGASGIPNARQLEANRQLAQADRQLASGGQIGSAETPHQIHVDRPAIEAKVQQAVGNWHGALSGSVADGRQLLREELEAPLRFTRVGKTYRFSAPVARVGGALRRVA